MVAPPRPSPAFQAISSRQGILGRRREEEHGLKDSSAGAEDPDQTWLRFATQFVGNAAQEVGEVGRDLADFGWSLQNEIREAASTPPDLSWPPLDCGEMPVDGCTETEEQEVCEVEQFNSSILLESASDPSLAVMSIISPESSWSLPESPTHQVLMGDADGLANSVEVDRASTAEVVQPY